MSRRTIWQLVAFVGALAMVFGGGYLFGDRVAPVAVAEGATDDAGADGMNGMEDGMNTGDGHNGDTDAAGGHTAEHADAVGVALSQNGFRLHLMSGRIVEPGTSTIRFHILGANDEPVTDYVRRHEKDLHLIVVAGDLSEFRHVHPRMDAAGEWSVEVNLSEPGTWRMYADFTPAGGDGLVLSTQLTVAGSAAPQPLPPPRQSTAVDGYRVAITGHPDAGESTDLTFTVSRAGRPVDDLQPYLGADGHLVAIRSGDLAYLHTHPSDHEPTGGPDITFATTFPTAGDYRVFLDFSHAGRVHTAAFTVTVSSHHR